VHLFEYDLIPHLLKILVQQRKLISYRKLLAGCSLCILILFAIGSLFLLLHLVGDFVIYCQLSMIESSVVVHVQVGSDAIGCLTIISSPHRQPNLAHHSHLFLFK
jgi:hypothetical protein